MKTFVSNWFYANSSQLKIHYEQNYQFVFLSHTAVGEVQNASFYWRRRGREDTHGEQLQASPTSQRQESAFLQLINHSDLWSHGMRGKR